MQNAEAYIHGVYIQGYRECYNISAELPGYSSQSEKGPELYVEAMHDNGR